VSPLLDEPYVDEFIQVVVESISAEIKRLFEFFWACVSRGCEIMEEAIPSFFPDRMLHVDVFLERENADLRQHFGWIWREFFFVFRSCHRSSYITIML
jgi:hypothetical protein